MSATRATQNGQTGHEKTEDQVLRAQWFWHMEHEKFTEERSVFFTALADGRLHSYLIRLAPFPSWSWSGTITALRFDPGEEPNVNVVIRSIELVRAKE